MAIQLDARYFAELAAELQVAETVTETADQAVAYAQEQLDADLASITLVRRRDELETIAPSDPIATQIDLLQYELREGCCFESAENAETLRSSSLATDPRWPRWGPRVAELGYSSVIAIGLHDINGRRTGALNLYWAEERSFSDFDVSFAHVFGRHAAVALSATLKETHLQTALDSRKRIGQAQGILMERFNLDEDQAFDVLRRYSQHHNEKLYVVAEELVTTRRLPAAEQPQID